MLDQIRIASPCSADWDRMEGDDRVRFCAECKKNVYNLSAMPRPEAEALVTIGNICGRITCAAEVRQKTTRRIGWAIAGALGLSTAFAQNTGAVTGHIKNEDGSAAANASVVFKSDAQTFETTTDEQGAFRAFHLPAGLYRITVADLSAAVEVSAGSATELVIARPATLQGMMSAQLKRKPWWRRLV